MRVSTAIIILAAGLAAGRSAFAAEEQHRQLGAHEHGAGKLNIAIQGKRVQMELEVPGADIVGFEHKASTPEQKAAIAKGKKTLAEALRLFAFPAEAKCKVTEAKVALHAAGEDDDHDHGKGEAKGHAHDHDKAGSEDEDEHEHNHSEFHAEYALNCAAPDKIAGLSFDYFAAFPGAQKLTVVVANGKVLSQYEVTRDKPKVTFGETG